MRFWATPDLAGPARDALWAELLAAGVDYLNTDDLAGLEAFLDAAGRPRLGRQDTTRSADRSAARTNPPLRHTCGRTPTEWRRGGGG